MYLAQISRQCRVPPSPESIQALLRVVGLRNGALWACVVTAGRTCVDVALYTGIPLPWCRTVWEYIVGLPLVFPCSLVLVILWRPVVAAESRGALA